VATIEDPLIDPPPREVPLPEAPLVRVLAQVRFPLVVSIEQREFIGPFQEALRSSYPVLRQEQTLGVVLGPAVLSQMPAQTAWRFNDADGRWRVSLTPEFVALETTAYKSRSDFLDRFRVVLAALEKHIEPKVIDRLGLRYIDRVVGPLIKDIHRLVRPEVLGIATTPAFKHVRHALAENLFEANGALVLARWGTLPPEATVDPAAIEPTSEVSWILDLDMFSASSKPFNVDEIVSDATRFAERLYTFFRWAVTDDFLRQFGGKP
jgi:uncharacterized protein (TIGR04255 family)